MAEKLGSAVLELRTDGKAYIKGLKDAEKRAQEADKRFKSVAKSAALIGASTAAAIATISVKAAIDFESSFAGIRKTVSATEAQFATLEKGMRELAKTIPVNVNELNKIGEAAGQLGIKTENILDFTKVMAELGVTTNLTSDQAATALARLANITQLPQTEFDRLGSTIVALGNNLATTEAEIVEFGLRLAGAGNQIGLTEAQILSIGAALSSVGIEAEAGGSAFSKLFIQLATAVETGNEQLAIFANIAGESIGEFQRMFEEDAAGAVQAFVNGLGDIQESGGSIIAILEELEITEVRMRDAILRAVGAGDLLNKSLEIGSKAWEENNALQREAEQRFKTTQSQLALLRNRVGDIAITIGQSLLPEINKVVKDFEEWLEKNEDLIAQDLVTVFNGITGAVKLLADGTSGALSHITNLVNELKRFNELTGLSSLINTVAQSIRQLGIDSENAGKSLREGFLVNLPIGTLGNDLKRINDDIKNIFGEREKSGQAPPVVSNLRQLGAVIQSVEGDMSQLAGVAGEVNREVEELGDKPPLPPIIGDDEKDKAKGLKDEIIALQFAIASIGKTPAEIIKIEAALKAVESESKELAEEWERLSLIKIGKEAIQSLKDTTKELKLQQAEIIATADELITLKVRLKEVELAEVGIAAGSEEAEKSLAAFRRELEKLNFVTKIDEMLKSGKLFDPLTTSFLKFQEQIQEFSEKTKDELDALDEFIGNVAANISNTIADMLTAAFTGNFDDIMRSWKDMLKNMLNIFFQFIAAIITNPIRVSLEGFLKGEGGGIGKFFSGGFEATKNLFTGNFEGFKGFADTFFKAASFIGTIVTFALGAFELIKGLFKKTPRLDIDFDSVKTELGRRAAIISEILDPEFFAESIAQISVKRGGVGLGAGGDEGIKKLIQERLTQAIESIQAIISKLPSDLFQFLNETLQNAELDIDTVIAGERLLEFDAKGKKIAEKFQAFIEGELPAKLFAAIRESFFEPAFEALGVSAEGAQSLIDQFLEDLEGAGSREERGKIGAAFLEDFNLFVDAFNVLSGTGSDSIGAAVNQLNALSESLGFEAVPSMEELRAKLEEFVRTADVDGVRSILELRNAIIQLRTEILSSISSIIGNIQSLNATIAAFGGASIDVTGFLNQAISTIMSLLSQPGLSIGEQEVLLGELTGFANQLLAEEQAAFNKAQAAQAEAAKKQQAAIQNTINSLNKEKSKVEEIFRTRIDALNEELRLIQDLESLIDSIRQNIQDLLLSPGGPESVFERISRAQSEISRLFGELGAAGPEQQIEIASRIQDLLNELNTLRQEGFQAPSPESDALFREIIGGLESLEGLIEPARSSEDIQASIETLTAENQAVLESIDAKIESAQTRLAKIGEQTSQNTFKMSQELQGLFEYIRSEYIRILEERFTQLEDVTDTGFATEIEGLTALVAVADEQVVELRAQTDSLGNIESLLAGMQGFQHGSGGLRNFGSGMLAVLHGKEAIVTAEQLAAIHEGTISRFMANLSSGAVSGLQKALAGGGGIIEGLAKGIGPSGLIQGFADMTGGGLIEKFAESAGMPDRISDMMTQMRGLRGEGTVRDFMRSIGENERVQIPEQSGGAISNLTLNLPPITFAPGQVANPDTFVRELINKLHDRRVMDEILKVTRGKV